MFPSVGGARTDVRSNVMLLQTGEYRKPAVILPAHQWYLQYLEENWNKNIKLFRKNWNFVWFVDRVMFTLVKLTNLEIINSLGAYQWVEGNLLTWYWPISGQWRNDDECSCRVVVWWWVVKTWNNWWWWSRKPVIEIQ